jgi:hypothetical protein
LIYINIVRKIVRIIRAFQRRKEPKMLKMTLAVAAAAVIVAATPLLVVSSPAQSEDLKLAQVQVEQPNVQIGPGGVTVGPKKPKCRTVTTTTETSDGRKITKREKVCDENR